MTKYRIMNQTTPAEPSPPGRILQRDLEALEVSHAVAARKLRLNITELEALLAGQLPITQALAERIAQAFGGRTEFWLELQTQFENHPKTSSRGGVRDGAGRKPLGLLNKTVRVTAKPDDMPLIEAWLNAQDSAAQAVAKLILRQAKRAAR